MSMKWVWGQLNQTNQHVTVRNQVNLILPIPNTIATTELLDPAYRLGLHPYDYEVDLL
jgi:hypothetical protein